MKSARNYLVWIVLGLLVLGLIGFGPQNFSGRAASIGQVGDKEITIDDYAREIQRQVNILSAQYETPVTVNMIRESGLDRQILQNLIARRVLENEAYQLGLSAGDAAVLEQIKLTEAFQTIGGEFSPEVYRATLRRSGINEADFEGSIRDELARLLLQSAVMAGTPAPSGLAQNLLDYSLQTRDIQWTEITASDGPALTPTPNDLRQYYDQHTDDFMTAEVREITAAVLLPSMIMDQVNLDDEALRALFVERQATYRQPERRLVERLVFASTEEAEEALATLRTGNMTFGQLVNARGLSLSDIDQGDVTEAELGEAGAAVFATEPDSVTDVVLTRAGPAIFRVNGILEARETPFEEAEPALREELAAARAARLVELQRSEIEDMIAGGATLEDLAKASDMELVQFDWSGGDDSRLTAYSEVTERLPSLTKGALPELIALSDAGLVALRLDEIIASHLRDFDEVSTEVEQAWRQQEEVSAARARAEDLAAQIRAGTDIASLGLDLHEELDQTRRGFILGAPPELITRAFTQQIGGVVTIDTQTGAVVAQVTGEGLSELTEDAKIAALARFDETIRQGIADDIFDAYLAEIAQNTKVAIDQVAVNAVNANLN